MKLFETAQYFLVSCALLCLSAGIAQAQNPDLTAVTEACPLEIISCFAPATLPITPTKYEWDFCTGDLLETPKVSIVSNNMNDISTPGQDAQRPESMDMVFDGQKWYGFIVNRGENSFLRADFGEDINNVPTYKKISINLLGVSAPKGIKVFKQGNNWGAIICNVTITAGQPRLVYVDFGTNLTNNSPTATGINVTGGSPIEAPRSLTLFKENGNYYAMIYNTLIGSPNRRKFTLLNFGASIGTTCTFVYDYATTSISGDSDIRLIREGQKIYGIMGGDTNNKLMVFDFGTSITNSPTLLNLHDYNILFPSTIGTSTPTQLFGLTIALDGANYVAHAIANTGDLFRIKFGNSMTNKPDVKNLGGFGLLGQYRPSQATFATVNLCMVKVSSDYYMFTMNRLTGTSNAVNELVKIRFPNLCNAEPSFAVSTDAQTAYSQSGMQYMNLTIFDEMGLPYQTYPDSVRIKEAMIGNFTYEGACLGFPTKFSNLSRGQETQVAGWHWDFGDGQSSTSREVSHTYAQAGVYQAKLTVNNFGGCTNNFTRTIRISSRPTAQFRVSQVDCATKSITFEDLSSIPLQDQALGGSIVNRTWLFGDGTRWIAAPNTATSYTKTYATNGSFIVTLTITDDAGCSTSFSQRVNLTATPTVDFVYTTPCTEVPVQFFDLSSLPANSIGELTDWQWTFYSLDNNVVATSVLREPIYTYTVAGNYKVKLRVRNSLGCWGEFIKNLQVLASPNTLFQASTLTGGAPLQVRFTNMTTGAAGFTWNFGTGEFSTEASPTYTFVNNGVYTVSFQARNAQGCGKIVTQTIIVEQTTAEEPTLPAALASFKIYPIPSNGKLWIEFEQATPQIEYVLTDLAGKKASEGKLPLQKNALSLDALPAGIYILQIKSENRFLVRKIIKI